MNLVFFCTCLLENSASNIPIIPQKITPHQGAVVSAGHDAEGTALRRCPGRVDSPNGVIAAIKKKRWKQNLTGAKRREFSGMIQTINNHPSNPHSYPFPTKQQ